MPRWTREEQSAIRSDIFAWLAERSSARPHGFTREELVSYEFDGIRIPLVDQYGKGIRNPAEFEATLSITTSADKRRNPYADEEIEDGFFRYDYRTGEGGDNVKLRRAAELGVPVIYFRQVVKAGRLVPTFPVYLRDDPIARCVHVAVDEAVMLLADLPDPTEDQRRYVDRMVKARLHQPLFRARVIAAYHEQCAICGLPVARLLDAAHITPDASAASSTRVTNGLAMCRIHHAAYDQDLIGIDRNYELHVDHELLEKVDGPILEFGLQRLAGQELRVDQVNRSERPDRERLAARFEQFRAA